MIFFKILLLVIPAVHAFCQETTVNASPSNFQIEILSAEKFDQFSENSDIIVEYCAGFGENGLVTIVSKDEKVFIKLETNNRSLLFGSINVTYQKDSYHYDQGIFPHITDKLSKHIKELNGIIPEHTIISNYLQEFKEEINILKNKPEEKDEKTIDRLLKITPQYVIERISAEHKSNPKLIFAVRMKMIIQLVGNDSDRTDFIMKEVYNKIIHSYQNYLGYYFRLMRVSNINEILSVCSQMLPHVIFSPVEIEDCFNDVVKPFYEMFFDGQIKSLSNLKALSSTITEEDFKQRLANLQAQKNIVENFIKDLDSDQKLKEAFNIMILIIADALIELHSVLPQPANETENA